jgi:hypothetical protein
VSDRQCSLAFPNLDCFDLKLTVKHPILVRYCSVMAPWTRLVHPQGHCLHTGQHRTTYTKELTSELKSAFQLMIPALWEFPHYRTPLSLRVFHPCWWYYTLSVFVFGRVRPHLLQWSVTAARSEAWAFVARTLASCVRIPLKAWMFLVLSCVCKCPAKGWSLIQGLPPNVKIDS